ncbi:MAG: Carboxyl-terminal protease [Candidatus Wolfebacteria bacterium GW2011_GWC2_39_22]|uniref:Carboxyl-terminal protease n=1 Tax=Candidatus Wolfebacteria bacterium GW2011_GWC2_39_22 TaxID=1619013 RepID=A0A0G0RHD7_9BACT|nr:MAG: Carboxyl-terminal protease [Candidatus Wolfebacteria bacterium GW2011_GWC2_39_22]
MSRGIKKFVYGIGFLLFFAGVIFGIYTVVFKAKPTCFDNKQNAQETGVDCGGVCAPCAQRYAQDITVESIIKFPANGRVVVIADLRNDNEDYGFRDVVYTMIAEDETGSVLGSTSNHTFIYDGKTKGSRYIVDLLDVPAKDIFALKVEFSAPEIVSSKEFTEPFVSIKRSSTDVVGLRKVIEPAYVFSREIKVGMTGDDVKNLEDFLYKKQLLKKFPDGTFDADAVIALKAYQKSKKLPTSGVLDTRTRTSINAEVDRVAKIVIDPNASVSISGNVKNDDLLPASKIIITGFLYDALGIQLGGSKTEINNLEAAAEEDFKIVFAKDIPLDKVDGTKTRVFIDSIK